MPIYTPKRLGTVPRWDKYDAYVGNFRGTLAADVDVDTEANKVLAVGINSDGAVVIGSGSTGIVGVIIVPVGLDIHGYPLDAGVNTGAGDVCDVGKHGEITNFVPSSISYAQTVILDSDVSGGTFTLTVGTKKGPLTTDDIAYNAAGPKPASGAMVHRWRRN